MDRSPSARAAAVPTFPGVAFHDLPPPSLVGQTLRESGIGERTGLTVIALEEGERLVTDAGPDTRLSGNSGLTDAHRLLE